MKHRETHPVDVPGCFGCQVLNVQINTSSAGAATVNERERQWDKDMPAYKRLRHNGLQPRKIDGCAALESQATDKLEVQMGGLIPKEQMSRVKEGMSIAKDMGWSPTDA